MQKREAETFYYSLVNSALADLPCTEFKFTTGNDLETSEVLLSVLFCIIEKNAHYRCKVTYNSLNWEIWGKIIGRQGRLLNSVFWRNTSKNQRNAKLFQSWVTYTLPYETDGRIRKSSNVYYCITDVFWELFLKNDGLRLKFIYYRFFCDVPTYFA